MIGPFRRPDPEEVVREHGAAVHRQLRRIFGPDTDVDDVFQAAFVEILRSLHGFKGRSKLSTWIRRITWNVAYQEMRLRYHHQRLVSLDEASTPGPSHTEPDELVFKRQAMRNLYAGLESLGPKKRMPLVMHDIEGMTLREISQILGRPVQTVASQLQAGRKQLAEWMQRQRRIAVKKERGAQLRRGKVRRP